MVNPRQASAVVVAAVFCAVVSNAIGGATRRLPWIGRYPNALKVPPAPAPAPTPVAPAPVGSSAAPVPARDYPPHPDRPWVDLTGEEAVELHKRGVPFLDARRTAVYEAGHIAGARSFPIWEASVVEAAIKGLFDQGYDVDGPLVIYCSGGDCEDSHMLAEKLHGFGFNNALVYTGGFPDWEKRAMPVEKGAPR
jgi:rhodanese-related sulfurtransferase